MDRSDRASRPNRSLWAERPRWSSEGKESCCSHVAWRCVPSRHSDCPIRSPGALSAAHSRIHWIDRGDIHPRRKSETWRTGRASAGGGYRATATGGLSNQSARSGARGCGVVVRPFLVRQVYSTFLLKTKGEPICQLVQPFPANRKRGVCPLKGRALSCYWGVSCLSSSS